jgi:sirohydrochlorin ferrochelatase
VALIGHSTRRNPTSKAATEAHAAHLRALYPTSQVEAVYLDDDPAIPTIYDSARNKTIVAVPYFLAAGSHTTQDVPTALGLQPKAREGLIGSHRVYYTPPLGVGTELVEAIKDLAHAAGMPAPATPASSSPWGSFPRKGGDLLWDVVEQFGELRFGQLYLIPDEVVIYTVGDLDTTSLLSKPSQIRRVSRELPFRPLSYPIPGGWVAKAGSAERLHAIVETVYPGAVADWASAYRGTFTTESLEDTLARQTGQYRALRSITPLQQKAVCDDVCRGCPRAPTWANVVSSKTIPCREACNVWLSAALGES